MGLGALLMLGLVTGGYPLHLPRFAQMVWGYSLLYGVAALGIVGVVRGQRVACWLEWPGVRRIGQISYGLYIWHLPLLVLFRRAFQFVNPYTVTGLIAFPVYLGVLLLLSELSYRFWERPWQRWAARRSEG